MYIGLDIGGSKVAAVALDARGQVVAEDWRAHRARGNAEVVSELLAAARRLTDTGPFDSVGVSVSGLVRRDGTITSGASLRIAGDLGAELAGPLRTDVRVVNDGDATLRSVLDRHEAETGERVADAVLLTLGTGVGGAMLADGRVVSGMTGLAGELGHLPVFPPTEARCVCGGSGCLEQYAGGMGIGVLAAQAVEAGWKPSHDVPSTPTAKHVVEAALRGDPVATGLLDQAAVACAQAVRAICVTIEPAVVFLGGSIAHGAAELLPARIEHHLHRHWSFAGLTTPPPVRLDAIGPFAAAIGAALLARQGRPSTTTSAATIPAV